MYLQNSFHYLPEAGRRFGCSCCQQKTRQVRYQSAHVCGIETDPW